MSFLSESASGIVPAKVVRLDRSRGAEMTELSGLVWADQRPPERSELALDSLDFSRAIGVDAPRDGGTVLAAMGSAWGFDTPVPGGRVNASGLTWVSVRPEFRRRGYLRALIAQHFEDCRERGEPVSMLFASEMAIYGRFGYGLGSTAVELKLARGAALRPLPGPQPKVEVRFETASFEAHGALVAALDHQAVHGTDPRTGATESPNQAALRIEFADEPPRDPAGEPLRIVIAARDGQPTGYALMRRDRKWEGGVADYTAEVRSSHALDPASGQALWEALLNIDLVTNVSTWLMPLDHPLLAWLEDWRSAKPVLRDAIHVRLIDLATAWESRRYSSPVDLRLAVRDSLLPGNNAVWRLAGGPDGASASRIAQVDDAAADLTLDIRELGSVWWGGVSAASLADAGLITEHTPGAARSLSQACAGVRAPAVGREF
ncbi:MAG: GNAT family N-acetyltransferase [Bifidobacteriaceae bacterium]|jgi:predicted acetyltransferase|nr:GNAT family N-acetyltransferase [Bifidobacteriaceae bacterium]